MDGNERRSKILDILSKAEQPVSGSQIARQMGVSRQVIVQDIALLRADHQEILATARGYMIMQQESPISRKIWSRHSGEEIEKELQIIVDLGGIARNVMVEHPIYGELCGELNISNRREAREFMRKVEKNEGSPLLTFSGGLHAHTIEAKSEEILDEICDALDVVGFLVK